MNINEIKYTRVKSGITVREIPFILISFFVPLILFYLTTSDSLMFDDAAEFALTIKLAGIAHPPGTPAYIFFGHIWSLLAGLFHADPIPFVAMFSGFCTSVASVFLFLTFRVIATSLNFQTENYRNILCALAATGFATSNTAWAWSNTIEVYSFQILAMSIALYGLFSFHFKRQNIFLFIAAFGLGAGLGNHHVTMILFLPFVLLFFTSSFQSPAKILNPKKKNNSATRKSFISELTSVFSQKQFWLLTVSTTIVTLFFYGWMFIRAQSDYPFMFGKPSTLSELFYHVSGGSYSKNLSSTSSEIINSRLPYFIQLTFLDIFIFLPFFIYGIIRMINMRYFRLFWMIVIYFLILFIYQINNNQWGSTDAYMLLPFVMLSIITFFGIISTGRKLKPELIVPVLLICQIAYFFPSHNRKTYPVSASLMKLLDQSSPKNSIVVISDWSTISQYYYYRLFKNFRTDLTVINYDIKFTHYKILENMYPEFYKSIKPAYDSFISELGKEHPHQVNNTGCDLNTPQLSQSFRNLINAIETVAKKQNRFFLTDPHAHNFYTTEKMYDPRRYISGCFLSSEPGLAAANDSFVSMNLPFLKSRLMLDDPGALDKLVDFQAMLDSYISFYTMNNDSLRLAKSNDARSYILKLQRDMKKSMSFAYKIK